MQSGVLNQKQMWALILAESGEAQCLRGYCNAQKGPGESSIDVPLGSHYYKMPASCRPTRTQTVDQLVAEVGGERLPIEKSTVFEPNKIYLVETPWTLRLPQNVRVRSTAKSSIGRLDALVRLVTDKGIEYDRIDPGGETRLFVEVVPLTFKLIPQSGRSLSQIRFIKGDEDHFVVPSYKLDYLDEPVLTYRDKGKVDLRSRSHKDGVLLTLDLSPDPNYEREMKGVVGFRAKQNCPAPIEPWKDKEYQPSDFWEPVFATNGRVHIADNRFYIFRSRERFHMPADLAVECQAYSESLGDIRIHYAGFAHPFFGRGRKDRLGAPLIFEVRGFSFDTYLWDSAPLARVHFWNMAEPAEKGDDSYTGQELTLSNCFKPWP